MKSGEAFICIFLLPNLLFMKIHPLTNGKKLVTIYLASLLNIAGGTMYKNFIFPSREELAAHARTIPEIHPDDVITMLTVMKAAEEIKGRTDDVLEREYHMSQGKLCVMIILHQHEEGMAPSQLARMAGVTKATISVMLGRMERDGQVNKSVDREDGRARLVYLTEKGRKEMDDILPGHYVRISKLIGKLNETEKKELVRLLHKIVDESPSEGS